MSRTDKILEDHNLKYEDLTDDERETINVMTSAIEKGQLTIPKIREHLEVMKEAVEMKLSVVGHESKEDIFLKARLRY